MSSHPLRVVLFDFDGTLADGYPAITDSVNWVRHRHGLSDLPESVVRPWVGRGLDQLLPLAVPGCNVADAVAEYRVRYAEIMVAGTRLLPGVEELLPQLQAAGCQLGVCSNKRRPFTEQLLGALGIRQYFAVVAGPEDVPQPKPAPDMLLYAARQLNATANELLYVGDMSVDVAAARAAGLPVWIVVTGSESAAEVAASGPDRQFPDMTALAAALELPGQPG